MLGVQGLGAWGVHGGLRGPGALEGLQGEHEEGAIGQLTFPFSVEDPHP